MCKDNDFGQRIECAPHVVLGCVLDLAKTDRPMARKIYQVLMVGKAYEQFHHDAAMAGKRMMQEHKSPGLFGFEVAKAGLETSSLVKEIEEADDAEVERNFANFEKLDQEVGGGIKSMSDLLRVLGAPEEVIRRHEEELNSGRAETAEELRADADIAPRKNAAKVYDQDERDQVDEAAYRKQREDLDVDANRDGGPDFQEEFTPQVETKVKDADDDCRPSHGCGAKHR